MKAPRQLELAAFENQLFSCWLRNTQTWQRCFFISFFLTRNRLVEFCWCWLGLGETRRSGGVRNELYGARDLLP